MYRPLKEECALYSGSLQQSFWQTVGRTANLCSTLSIENFTMNFSENSQIRHNYDNRGDIPEK